MVDRYRLSGRRLDAELMAINRDKTDLWKADVRASVDMYNEWFFRFAPVAYQDSRRAVTIKVEDALRYADDLRRLSPDTLRAHPETLPVFRMSTAPPIARDRLIGLAQVQPSLRSTDPQRPRATPTPTH